MIHNIYTIGKWHNNGYNYTNLNLFFGYFKEISYNISFIDIKYINYYIDEISKLKDQDIFKIITYDTEGELEILVDKDYLYNQTKTEKIDTSEFIELLYVTKEKLNLDNTIIPYIISDIKVPRFTYHSYPEAVQVYGEENIRRLNVRNTNDWGAYEADIELNIDGVWSKIYGESRSFFPDDADKETIQRWSDEAFKNIDYSGQSNIWLGKTNDQKEIVLLDCLSNGASFSLNFYKVSYPNLRFNLSKTYYVAQSNESHNLYCFCILGLWNTKPSILNDSLSDINPKYINYYISCISNLKNNEYLSLSINIQDGTANVNLQIHKDYIYSFFKDWYKDSDRYNRYPTNVKSETSLLLELFCYIKEDLHLGNDIVIDPDSKIIKDAKCFNPEENTIEETITIPEINKQKFKWPWQK